jgi:hypothetical protein
MSKRQGYRFQQFVENHIGVEYDISEVAENTVSYLVFEVTFEECQLLRQKEQEIMK